jgi:hypothetical protein
VPDWILGYEFEECGIAKVVCALEDDALMDKIWVLLQQCAKTGFIACIKKFNGPTKQDVVDLLVARQLASIRGS